MKQSLKKEKVICGLVNDPILTTGPVRGAWRAGTTSWLSVCYCPALCLLHSRGSVRVYWVTNEEIDVQPMEGSSYNSCTFLSQEEKSPQLIHDKHMDPKQPGD